MVVISIRTDYSRNQWRSHGGVGGYNPIIDPQVTLYLLRLFLTFFLKRWILLLLFLKEVSVGLSRLFYVNWTRSQRRVQELDLGGDERRTKTGKPTKFTENMSKKAVGL